MKETLSRAFIRAYDNAVDSVVNPIEEASQTLRDFARALDSAEGGTVRVRLSGGIDGVADRMQGFSDNLRMTAEDRFRVWTTALFLSTAKMTPAIASACVATLPESEVTTGVVEESGELADSDIDTQEMEDESVADNEGSDIPNKTDGSFAVVPPGEGNGSNDQIGLSEGDGPEENQEVPLPAPTVTPEGYPGEHEAQDVRKAPTFSQVMVENSGTGGAVPEEVRASIDAAVTFFGSGIRVGYVDNGQAGNGFRWNLFPRNASGEYLWASQRLADGSNIYDNYPTHLVLTDLGPAVDNGYEYSTVPGSEDAVVVYVGENSVLPALAKNSVSLEDGSEVFSTFFDVESRPGEWKWVPDFDQNGLAVINGQLNSLNGLGEMVVVAPIAEDQVLSFEAGEHVVRNVDGTAEYRVVAGEVIDVPNMGEVVVDENGFEKIAVGESSAHLPVDSEIFDAAHIVVEDGRVHYRSEGLTVVWSEEAQDWVFPEEFYYKVGKVVPVSLMGGKLEIDDQAEAWRAHQQMVLSFLNNKGNDFFVRKGFGEAKVGAVTWDDLRVVDETGQEKFLIPLFDLNGEESWPDTMFDEDSRIGVVYHSLKDYIDDPESFGGYIDVSSPLWMISGHSDWARGDGNFVENELDGSRNIFGVVWANHGFKFLNGRLAWVGYSSYYFDDEIARDSILGGVDGSEVDPELAEAFLLSTQNSLEKFTPDESHALAIPNYENETLVGNTLLTGVSKSDASAHFSSGLFSNSK